MSRAGLSFPHWGLILLALLVLKQGYSLAGAGQLQWLLMPLAMILNALGGFAFQLQPGGQWLDVGRELVLVKGCAGGNILLTLWLAYLWRWRQSMAPSLHVVLRAAAAAWLTTLIANALRILLAVHAQSELANLAGLGLAESHRLLGIGVYVLSLWLVLARSARMHAALVGATGFYLGVNLMLPLARAAWLNLPAIDASHLVWTAGVPLALLGVSWSIRWAWSLRLTQDEP